MKTLTMDKDGGTSACSLSDGQIRLEIWTEERQRHEDPIYVKMTVGQALGLINDLSGSAKAALLRSLK